MNSEIITCPQCSFEILVPRKLWSNYRGRNAKKEEKQHPHRKSKEGWACPKCHNKHYHVYANVCPSCGLDFNSEEFNQIVRNLH